MIGDLHFHSDRSDGNKSLEERVRQIQTLDPQEDCIWTLTDHDRISDEFVGMARSVSIKTCPSVEISARCGELGHSFHVTYYAHTIGDRLRGLLNASIVGNLAYMQKKVTHLQNKGFQITWGQVIEWTKLHGMNPDFIVDFHVTRTLWETEHNRQHAHTLTNENFADVTKFRHAFFKKTGKYAHLGHVDKDAQYEPDIETLADIAQQEGGLLSVAHPNFSFTRYIKKHYPDKDTQEVFIGQIFPRLADQGYHIELNALAGDAWSRTILACAKKHNTLMTWGSDNHGLEHVDQKHEVLGKSPSALTPDIVISTQKKLGEFIC